MDNKYKVTCLVNDCVLFGSNFWGEHGQSFLIEGSNGDVLYDAGMTSGVIAHNLQELRKNLKNVRTIAISHGHNDHTGGLMWAIEEARNAKVVAAPELFGEKWIKRKGKFVEIGIPFTREAIEEKASVILSRDPIELLPGVVLSGDIPRIHPEENPDPGNWKQDNDTGEIDDFPDDRSLFLKTEKGIVIITGCCHAGLINTIDYASDLFSAPIRAVVGGNHLITASPAKIEWIFSKLSKQPSCKYYLNHCVGIDTYGTFLSRFKKSVKYIGSGDSIQF